MYSRLCDFVSGSKSDCPIPVYSGPSLMWPFWRATSLLCDLQAWHYRSSKSMYRIYARIRRIFLPQNTSKISRGVLSHRQKVFFVFFLFFESLVFVPKLQYFTKTIHTYLSRLVFCCQSTVARHMLWWALERGCVLSDRYNFLVGFWRQNDLCVVSEKRLIRA